MSDRSHPTPTAADALHRLEELRFELAIAAPSGLDREVDYMQDLRDDIAASETLFVGLAVTEIATLRAELGAPLQG